MARSQIDNTVNSHFSRRVFLAGAATAAGAIAVPRAFAQPATAPADQKKLGIAMVGLGGFCMNQLMPSFVHCKLAKMVALVSGHPDKAAQQAAKYGIDPKNIYNYDNFDTIKDNPAIDAVYIVLPNGMHAEYTIRAAKAGKHVLCEKPMANTVEECQAMIDACAAAKKKLQIGYRMRYDPITLRAIELARSATEIGTIKQISAECGFNIGPNQWRLTKKLAGGGSLMDIGIYALHAVRYLAGEEPTDVMAISHSTPGDPRFTEVEETISFELAFKSGIVASVLSTYGFGCNRFKLYGTRGQLDSEPFQGYSGNHLWLSTRGNNKQEQKFDPFDHFAAEIDNLCACAMQDKAPLTAGEEGLKDLKVMMAAYESARTGKSVKIV